MPRQVVRALRLYADQVQATQPEVAERLRQRANGLALRRDDAREAEPKDNPALRHFGNDNVSKALYATAMQRQDAGEHRMALALLQKIHALHSYAYRPVNFALGELYADEDIRTIPRDYGEALHHFEQAANQGCARSQLYLLHHPGLPVAPEQWFAWGEHSLRGENHWPQDNAAALRCFEKAAHGGHDEAAFRCGQLHEKGIGTAASPYISLVWYLRAYQLGVTGAAARIHELARKRGVSVRTYLMSQGLFSNSETVGQQAERELQERDNAERQLMALDLLRNNTVDISWKELSQRNASFRYWFNYIDFSRRLPDYMDDRRGDYVDFSRRRSRNCFLNQVEACHAKADDYLDGKDYFRSLMLYQTVLFMSHGRIDSSRMRELYTKSLFKIGDIYSQRREKSLQHYRRNVRYSVVPHRNDLTLEFWQMAARLGHEEAVERLRSFSHVTNGDKILWWAKMLEPVANILWYKRGFDGVTSIFSEYLFPMFLQNIFLQQFDEESKTQWVLRAALMAYALRRSPKYGVMMMALQMVASHTSGICMRVVASSASRYHSIEPRDTAFRGSQRVLAWFSERLLTTLAIWGHKAYLSKPLYDDIQSIQHMRAQKEKLIAEQQKKIKEQKEIVAEKQKSLKLKQGWLEKMQNELAAEEKNLFQAEKELQALKDMPLPSIEDDPDYQQVLNKYLEKNRDLLRALLDGQGDQNFLQYLFWRNQYYIAERAGDERAKKVAWEKSESFWEAWCKGSAKRIDSIGADPAGVPDVSEEEVVDFLSDSTEVVGEVQGTLKNQRFVGRLPESEMATNLKDSRQRTMSQVRELDKKKGVVASAQREKAAVQNQLEAAAVVAQEKVDAQTVEHQKTIESKEWNTNKSLFGPKINVKWKRIHTQNATDAVATASSALDAENGVLQTQEQDLQQTRQARGESITAAGEAQSSLVQLVNHYYREYICSSATAAATGVRSIATYLSSIGAPGLDRRSIDYIGRQLPGDTAPTAYYQAAYDLVREYDLAAVAREVAAQETAPVPAPDTGAHVPVFTAANDLPVRPDEAYEMMPGGQ